MVNWCVVGSALEEVVLVVVGVGVGYQRFCGWYGVGQG